MSKAQAPSPAALAKALLAEADKLQNASARLRKQAGKLMPTPKKVTASKK